MTRYPLLCFLILWLAACNQPSASDQPLTVGELQVQQAMYHGQEVTLQGSVTSRRGDTVSLQSDHAALLVSLDPPPLPGQSLIVTGRLEIRAGVLWLQEASYAPQPQEVPTLPEAVPLTTPLIQRHLLVEIQGAVIDEAGTLFLPDGQRLALYSEDPEVQRRLRPGSRLDRIEGVLYQAGPGWLLVPPLADRVQVAPPLLLPCQLQGSGARSPYKGQYVESVGVVTSDRRGTAEDGVFIQVAECDDDPATSDALFVSQLPPETPALLQSQVRVRGTMRERYGRTELQVAAGGLWVEASGVALPTPIPLSPASPPYEALEGMLVTLEHARAVGPSNRFGELAVIGDPVAPFHLMEGDRRADQIVLVSGLEGLPVGTQVTGLVGPLDYSFAAFKLHPTMPPTVLLPTLPTLAPLPPLLPQDWSLVTFNVENLFDSQDDPTTHDDLLSVKELEGKLDRLAQQIAGPLGQPTLVALQEVESLALLEALAAHPALQGRYTALLLEGHDPRGIEQGFLLDRARVTVLEAHLANPCTTLVAPGGGPRVACPPGEHALFERPPLLLHLQLDDGEPFYLLNAHFKSKRGGAERTQPRRLAQARYVAALAEQLQQGGGEIIVVGDLNEGLGSAPLLLLQEEGRLLNLWERVEAGQRYSYIYQGRSQAIDHILVSSGLAGKVRGIMPRPLNADYPAASQARSSDHDPLWVLWGP